MYGPACWRRGAETTWSSLALHRNRGWGGFSTLCPSDVGKGTSGRPFGIGRRFPYSTLTFSMPLFLTRFVLVGELIRGCRGKESVTTRSVCRRDAGWGSGPVIGPSPPPQPESRSRIAGRPAAPLCARAGRRRLPTDRTGRPLVLHSLRYVSILRREI